MVVETIVVNCGYLLWVATNSGARKRSSVKILVPRNKKLDDKNLVCEGIFYSLLKVNAKLNLLGSIILSPMKKETIESY